MDTIDNTWITRLMRRVRNIYYTAGVAEYILAIGLGVAATFAIDFSGLAEKAIRASSSREAAKDDIFNLVNTILAVSGFVLAIFLSVYFVSRSRRLHSSLRRLADNQKTFLALATDQREHEKALFDRLVEASTISQASVKDTSMHLVQNMQTCLDMGARLFTELTTHQCAVCIKLIVEGPGAKSPLDYQVITFLRDRHSNRLRKELDRNRFQEGSTHSVPDLVKNHTPDEALLTPLNGEYRRDLWVNDDLISLHRAGEYKNSRPNWHDDYNATLVCGIRELKSDRTIPWFAIFCVDNKRGGLDTGASKHYARELSIKLSLMLYQYDRLRRHRRQR